MPATGLLALIDDITAIMDDVAVLSKVAAQKTAGIAGDDLAVNAEGLVGIEPSRELPIVGKVALGSLVNKTILVPVALLLPTAAITPLLMVGGTYLCFEGFHKVWEKVSPHDDAEEAAEHAAVVAANKAGPQSVAELERTKVKQAIVTDFVLSAEIVAVALGAVVDEPMATKATVLALVAALMTVAIYGIVGLLVKLDDIGLHLQRRSAPGSFQHRLGGAIVAGVPYLMKTISVVGTAAMFLVGGGIFVHGIPGAEDAVHHFVEGLSQSDLVQTLVSSLGSLALGVVVGAIATVVFGGIGRAWKAVRGQG
ncbi:MAG: DUF808 domain-containing protein [Alphaproteobacteria bacterium]|nr:DUF808 domain-containing protein [Alphaproteobacteria bacterium]